MKKLLLITIATLCMATVFAQQNFINKFVTPENSDQYGLTLKDDTRVGIVGIGSLNTEELTKTNSSGKLAAFFIPARWDISPKNTKAKWYLVPTLYTSYNINATNNDSLLSSTVLFPELGNSSFLGTVELAFSHISKKDLNSVHSISVLGEFANKSVRVNNKDTNVFFNVLNYTVGLKFMSTRYVSYGKDTVPMSLAITPYLHWANVPNEDNGDYRYLLDGPDVAGQPVLPSTLSGWGVKVAFSLKDFQFFADFRNVTDTKDRILNRSLKGYTSNLGVIVSASILEFQ